METPNDASAVHTVVNNSIVELLTLSTKPKSLRRKRKDVRIRVRTDKRTARVRNQSQVGRYQEKLHSLIDESELALFKLQRKEYPAKKYLKRKFEKLNNEQVKVILNPIRINNSNSKNSKK
jgi:hypothetical protein